MKPKEAARGYPIRLRGTVLYCDARWRILYLQDQNDAAYFYLAENQPEARSGDLVELDAVSTVKNEGPGFANVRLKVVGQAALPEPIRLEIGSLLKGAAMNQRVAFRGLVERVDYVDNRLRLRVQIDARHAAEVFVRKFRNENLADLENAVVIIQGVNASYEQDPTKPRQLKFFVPVLEDVIVAERERGDPFQRPIAPLAQVHKRVKGDKFEGPNLRRVHVRARAVEQKLGEWIRVQDDSGWILVRSELRAPTQTGDMLDIAGYRRLAENGEAFLHSSVFQVLGEASASLGPSPKSGLPLLETVQQVRNLSPEEARRGYPIRLKGVVTYYDREWRVLFIHDHTGGIYIDSADQEFLLDIGQRVEVSGVSDPGGYAPMVTRVKLRVVGPGALPEPKRIALENLTTGREDSQWIELEGVVRAVEVNGRHLILQLKAPTGPFQVTVPVPPPSPLLPRLVDSKLKLRGACGVLANVYRQLVGINLHVPNWTQIEFLRTSPEDPFAVAATPIRDLLRFTPQDIFEHRVRIRGVVTLVRQDDSIFLQDDTGGTRIQAGRANAAQIGELVDAVGFPVIGGYTPMLDKVRLKRVGRGDLPAPVPIPARALLKGTNDAQRVCLEARLIDTPSGTHAVELALEDAGVVFNAILGTPLGPGQLERFRAGSVLQATGVCQVQVDEWRNVRSFRLLVPSLADLQVLRSPSWWSLQRVFALLGGMSGILLLAVSWIMALRRRVGKQTEVIRHQLEQLQQARKMESVGQLAAGVAHDFNNILTIIQGNAALLAFEEPAHSPRGNLASAIVAASERAAGLTRQLVLFSRKQRMQLRVLDLNEVVRELVKMFRRVLGEQIELELSCGPDLPPIRGDRGMLEQVLLNLAVNSRDAMLTGGRLRMSTARVEISADAVKQNPDARPGLAALLEVRDTGCGIPPEILPRIFEPFFTTKDIGKGTGLGLATVYGIVKQHSGWIQVASAIGEGTTFQIFLPATAEAPKAEVSRPAAPTLRRGHERILLVEDEVAVRDTVVGILTSTGYKVFVAATGAEAQQVWREQAGEFDLLLTDVVMPGGLSGLDLAERLVSEAPDLKVIFTSGYSPELASGRFHFKERDQLFAEAVPPPNPARYASRMPGPTPPRDRRQWREALSVTIHQRTTNGHK